MTVTLDLSQPQAPSNLTATPIEDGKIQLSWKNNEPDAINGFRIYRSTSSFTDISAVGVEIVNETSTQISFTDQLTDLEDGEYFYRVATVNDLGLEGPASNIASAIADGTAPEILSIAYTPQDAYDEETGRFGLGTVNVEVTFSENYCAAIHQLNS